MSRADDLPVILGGTPVRVAGPPSWPGGDVEMNAAVAASVNRCFTDGTWGAYCGPNFTELQQQLATMHDCSQTVLCASGTAAVELALRGLRVGVGDGVLLSGYDFKGNFQNVLTVGATPILVDADSTTGTISLERLTAAIESNENQSKSKKTTVPITAMIVSHLHGGCVEMAAIMRLAEQYNIAVIEDACQMPGAMIDGKIAGMSGDVGVLSFGGSKLLSAGRGGAVLTNHAEIAQRIRLHTQRGNEAYPLSELQAAALLPQLEMLADRNKKRTETVQLLTKELHESFGESSGILPFQNNTQTTTAGFYKLGFFYDAALFNGLSRDQFSAAMRAEGIALDAGFRTLSKTHSRRRFRTASELPIAESMDDSVLTLHHPILLEGATAVQEIITAIKKIKSNAAVLCESFGR